MKDVLVYAPRVLPISLTFVEDQVRAMERWAPVLVGRERVPRGLEVDDLVPPEMDSALAKPSRAARSIQQATRRVRVLASVVKRQQPALLHAHFLTAGFDVIASVRPLPCPVVITAHGFDATWFGSPPATFRPDQWLHGALRRSLLRKPVRFLAVSKFIRDELVRLGAPPDRVLIHHTGVDTRYFTPPPPGVERSGVLFVGRLVPKKGVLDLLEAVARLRAEGILVPVEVIGDGPQRPALERFIRQERLDVILRGSMPREAVREAMRRSAVQCNPSRTASSGDREGFGMVLAEAQSTGLPVVASASGGMIDAVNNGRTGVLVPEADPRALADALRSVLVDDALRSRLGAAARPWVVEHFDLEKQTFELENLYDAWTTEVGR